MDGLEIRRKRAIYRAHHRGTKELDLILGRYAKEHVPGMDDVRLTVFEQLIALPDADINQWIARGKLRMGWRPSWRRFAASMGLGISRPLKSRKSGFILR